MEDRFGLRVDDEAAEVGDVPVLLPLPDEEAADCFDDAPQRSFTSLTPSSAIDEAPS